MIREYLEQSKADITAFLEERLPDIIPEAGGSSAAGRVCGDLLSFTRAGKMLRGTLCRLGYELYSRRQDTGITAAGAAAELAQSAFLIHDDIMDRDTLRRGGPAMHITWGRRAEEQGIDDAAHLGESLAICSGDLALFAAYRVIADFCGPAAGEMAGLFSRELAAVAAAQMLDTMYGAGWSEPSEKDVLALYARKTGRYTFSLPLSAGALMAGVPEPQRRILEKAGELLGIAFQLKDDELGIFGDEEALGKPVGSDVREGKKTPFYLRLAAAGRIAEDLTPLFGRQDLQEEDLHRIRDRLEILGIRHDITAMMEEHTLKALELTASMEDLREEPKALLRELAEYNLERER